MSEARTDVTDLVSAIARLLSNQVLLEQFEQNAAAVAKQFHLSPRDRERFLLLDASQLKQQARSLLLKRWHEVQRLAQRTTELLSDDGEEIFCYYASSHWPQGHRRHSEDAYRFLEFLAANEIVTPLRHEQMRLRKLAT